MLIDTHAHYNLEPIFPVWEQHWEMAKEKGIGKSIVVGTNLQTSKLACDLAGQNPDFFASVGVHPHDIDQLDIKNLDYLIGNNKKVVAIGEIGLDFFWLEDNEGQIKKDQQKGFLDQINLANEYNLPAIIHIRDKITPENQDNNAYTKTAQIMKDNPIKNNFVLHCVSGPISYIKEMVELGAFFGFDGNITYKNADHLREILKLVPDDRVVIETDAPYLPPVPYRGQTCEPWMISITAKYIEENFGISEAQLESNSLKLISGLYHNQPES